MNAQSRHDSSSVREVGPYSVRISDAPDDPAWDDFVEQSPIGHYAQTSCWGRVRASIGWRPVRAVVSDNGRVVAGVQILARPLPAGGYIGFVSRGPVVSEDRPDLVRLVFDEMMATGKASKVQYLVVYAPRSGDWMSDELMRRGFRPSVFEFDYTATVCINLQPGLDELLARMRKKTRQHIRTAAGKHDVTVRRGSEADLPLFNRLKDAHAARLGYNRRDASYYTELWRALAPRGHVELLIAEHEGEPISAFLAIPFGDTCYHMERPWSGKHADLRPNELIEWELIRWAKSEGYRFADLVAVKRSAVEAMLAGERRPSELRSAESFKLGFGGDLVLLPQGYDYVYNPVLRLGYQCIPNKVLKSRHVDRLIRKLRGVG